MITNKILERIRNGEKALGITMSQPSTEIVELAGRMGLDFVGLDAQHSPVSPEMVQEVCRIADGFGVTVTMRVPDGRESTILSYLDRGVREIQIPNLQTREEAEALVKYAYFAPKGLRSATSVRTAFNQKTGDYTQLYAEINANTVLVPQLESITVLENLDDILTVDGIDYFARGPEDMAQSLGLTGQATHPKVQEAYARIDEKLHAAGKHWITEFTESVSVLFVVNEAAEALLKKHGRESQLRW